MTTSSRTRRKSAFVPWFAALVFGASAHAGWLVHEFDHGRRVPSFAIAEHEGAEDEDVDVDVDVEIHVDVEVKAPGPVEIRVAHSSARALEPLRRGQGSRALRPSARTCRHATARPGPFAERELEEDLELWIQQRARYHYVVDRRVLEGVAAADLSAGTKGDAPPSSLEPGTLVELRNIREGTPLHVLGLRNGDRVRSLVAIGDGLVERVEVGLERRGRTLQLVYELV